MITIERCRCPGKNCPDYWLVGVGKFVQGSGFEKEDATRIAHLINMEEAPQEFMYFEIQDSGMQVLEFRLGERPPLRGWMERGCKEADTGLVKWMEEAMIGDTFEHRLGTCVRVRPS